MQRPASSLRNPGSRRSARRRLTHRATSTTPSPQARRTRIVSEPRMRAAIPATPHPSASTAAQQPAEVPRACRLEHRKAGETGLAFGRARVVFWRSSGTWRKLLSMRFLYGMLIADDLSVQFGEGQEFYVQWRQRFSPEMLSTRYEGGNGWKQAVIGEGSRPGHTAYTCTDIQIVLEDTYQVGAPRMYHSCGKKDGQFEPFQVYSPSDQGYLIQNAVGCVHFRVVSPPCFMYKPNQWMTFQIHVKVGTWYHNDKKYRRDSTVQLWAADEGKPSKLLIDFSPARGTGYDLVNFDPEAKYGKVWLLPYDTNKDASQDHPTAYTWYDDLIISRNKIADPD